MAHFTEANCDKYPFTFTLQLVQNGGILLSGKAKHFWMISSRWWRFSSVASHILKTLHFHVSRVLPRKKALRLYFWHVSVIRGGKNRPLDAINGRVKSWMSCVAAKHKAGTRIFDLRENSTKKTICWFIYSCFPRDGQSCRCSVRLDRKALLDFRHGELSLKADLATLCFNLRQ